MQLSIVIPTRNHAETLKKCLESVQKQSKKPFEVIVVDGHSTDDTPKIVKKNGCKIVYDDLFTIGNAYFTGAAAAKGEIVVFIDDDAQAPVDLLSKIEKYFSKNNDIDILGGEDLLNQKATNFQKATYQTDLAVRPKQKIYGNKAWRWLRAACISYRKSALDKFNFNPYLSGLQEPELHQRMRKGGMKAVFDPSIFVYHERRKSLSGIWNQIYRNGMAKIDLLRLHPNSIAFYDVIPPTSILVTVAAFYSGFMWVWISILIIYFITKPAFILAKTGALKYYPLLLVIVIVREAAYSFGILRGLTKFNRSKRRKPE